MRLVASRRLRHRKLSAVTAQLFSRQPGDGSSSKQFATTELVLPDPDAPNPDTFTPDSLVTDAGGNAAVPDVLTDTSGLPLDALDTAQAPTLSHIGRYALKRPLGEGGLGTVYEAWDPLLSRAVAVKTLQLDTDPATRGALDGLFLNEARAAAGLNHRYIVTIHDAGLSPHGVYIAMERLYGRDLRQALAAGWRPRPEQTAQLVRRIGEALAYAHARGVVHCDVKPANIFLQRRDKPKVLDFGIARLVNGRGLPALDGAVLGSPRYRAPEQLTGTGIDARTDLFSLGAVMYELLVARHAFDGDSLAAIDHAVLNTSPPAPHTLDPRVPRELSDITMRLLERDPATRYTCASELTADLRRWLQAQQPVRALVPPAPPPRRRAGIGLRLALACAVAAGLAAAALAWRAGPPAAKPSSPAVPVAVQPAPPPAAEPVAAPALAVPSTVEAVPATDPPATAAVERPPVPVQAAPVRAPRTTANPVVRGATVAAPASENSEPAAAAAPALGVVQLAVSPWAEVEVNGQPAGTTPPLTRLSLPEGAHTVTLRNADFPPHVVQLQVNADRPVQLRHRFGS